MDIYLYDSWDLQNVYTVINIPAFGRLCDLVVTDPGYRPRRPRYDSRRYKIFWEVGLERGPLSLARINEELLEIKRNSVSGLENRE
jgi:hypothetical protein